MSFALYGLGGLRFWTEDEIELREAFTTRCVSVVRRALIAINKAWSFARVDGPCLTPQNEISNAYGNDDVFITNHTAAENVLALRAETTASSYAYAEHLLASGKSRLPLCVWQAGKSFRRECNDGASASKMRFNEFWQLEFQCIYSIGTKADYRSALIDEVAQEIGRFTRHATSLSPSDRLPSYAESTIDIEAAGREMASCSIRTDFTEDTRVCEIAVGLDRVATLACCACGDLDNLESKSCKTAKAVGGR